MLFSSLSKIDNSEHSLQSEANIVAAEIDKISSFKPCTKYCYKI